MTPVVARLGSLKLAVCLLSLLAAVLACATVLETKHGAAYAQWYVYDAAWFVGLLCLLGLNILCAALSRFPWKRPQTGFVVTHAGLLILLAGAVQTFIFGIEGQVSLIEGESTSTMLLPHRSQVTAAWVGKSDERPYEFQFDAGPVNWPDGKTLDVGEVDGVRAEILAFYRHAKVVQEWIADETEFGGPVVKLAVAGADGKAIAEHWLPDEKSGNELYVGPIRLQLAQSAGARMLADFLSPPTADLGEKGVLLAYYKDAAERIAVETAVGRKVPLGETGAVVEIVEYLPNARPDALGRFTSKDDRPKNPLLELKVHLPGETEPLRQIAFADSPLLNLDGVFGRVCPVKFRYNHPRAPSATAVELLQAADGKLYGRVFSQGRYESCGELSTGSKIQGGGGFDLSLAEYIPHGRRRITFEPVAAASSAKETLETVVHVEISTAGATQKVWLAQNHPVYGMRSITTPQGTLQLALGRGRLPLGFSLSLKDFQRDVNPGQVGNAAFASMVHVDDESRGLHEDRRISMNEPLTHGKFTFYQSGFDDAGHGREASTFSVAYDPGRALKYLGSLMVCLGIAVMFYMRAYFFKRVPRLRNANAAGIQDVALGTDGRRFDHAVSSMRHRQPRDRTQTVRHEV